MKRTKKSKRSLKWKKIIRRLWDNEDSHLFGQILILIGGFLIIKWVESFIPIFEGKKWIYFLGGFLFIWVGIKLIIKRQRSDKKS